MTNGKRVLRPRGIFSLFGNRRAKLQVGDQIDVLDLTEREDAKDLSDSAERLLNTFIVPRLLKRISSSHGASQSDIVFEKTHAGYTFTLGKATLPVSSSLDINEEILQVALNYAPEYELIPSKEGNKATFTMRL